MKKIVPIILCVILAAFGMGACGKVNYTDNETTVIIDCYKGGYGVEFLNELAAKFEQANPGTDIVVKDTVLRNQIIDRIKSGPKSNPADIVMTNGDAYATIAKGSQFGNETLFEPLTEVYDAIGEGNKTIRELTMPSIKNVTTFKPNGLSEKEYFMIWATSLQGIIYHTDELSDAQIPNTTNELIALAKNIKADGKNAFIYSGSVDYWTPIHLVWWAQYAGEEAYNKFYEGQIKEKDPFTDEEKYVTSNTIFTMPGRLQSLEIMEELLNNANGYTDKRSTGLSFSDAQIDFLKKKAIMHPNGDWIENEAKQNVSDAQIAFMKTPVISDIIDKLTSVKTDEKLSEVVSYVDGKTTIKPAGVTDEDIERVRSARNMSYLASTTHFVGIPAYSNAKPLAKEFLKYMYSYEGAKIVAESTCGMTLPVSYDFSEEAELNAKITPFQKSRMKIQNSDTVSIYQRGYHPISYKGGLRPYSYNWGVLEAGFGATNEKDRMTAEQILAYDLDKYDTNGWNNLLTMAGLK